MNIKMEEIRWLYNVQFVHIQVESGSDFSVGFGSVIRIYLISLTRSRTIMVGMVKLNPIICK